MCTQENSIFFAFGFWEGKGGEGIFHFVVIPNVFPQVFQITLHFCPILIWPIPLAQL